MLFFLQYGDNRTVDSGVREKNFTEVEVLGLHLN